MDYATSETKDLLDDAIDMALRGRQEFAGDHEHKEAVASRAALDAHLSALLAERDALATRVADLLAGRATDDAEYGALRTENERMHIALGRLSSPSWVCEVASVLRMSEDADIEAMTEVVAGMTDIARAALNP